MKSGHTPDLANAATESVDCVVIGTGVVGLAVARELAMAGREVIIVEAADAIGTGASSRNSEVIHAGLYYPKDSLKGRLCVEGKQMLYAYCREHGVPHDRIGKVVVAVHDAEIPALRSYVDKAHANGVDDLQWLTQADLREIEPAVRCVAGLHSPSTGIIDSHALMLALLGDAEHHGAMLALQSPVESGAIDDDGIVLNIGGSEQLSLRCNSVINSAGLHAQDVARSITGLDRATIPRQYLTKGHYYAMSGPSPFNRLVYPMATNTHLGVHVTLDLGGQARFGPDVSAIDAVDYSFDTSREAQFYAAIRKYYPGLGDGALQPGYTGIRSKLVPPDQPPADFIIQGPKEHGITGLVNLYGIESPGLTASLAIAGEVAKRHG